MLVSNIRWCPTSSKLLYMLKSIGPQIKPALLVGYVPFTLRFEGIPLIAAAHSVYITCSHRQENLAITNSYSIDKSNLTTESKRETEIERERQGERESWEQISHCSDQFRPQITYGPIRRPHPRQWLTTSNGGESEDNHIPSTHSSVENVETVHATKFRCRYRTESNVFHVASNCVTGNDKLPYRRARIVRARAEPVSRVHTGNGVRTVLIV